MKKLIKDFNRNEVTVLLITAVDGAKTKGGKDYCRVTLTDGEQTITANMWDISADTFPIKPGNLAKVSIEVGSYNNQVSYVLSNVGKAPDMFDINDYVPSAPIDAKEAYERILAIAHSSGDGELTDIVDQLYMENKEKILFWSAAKSVHHNIRCGFLYHTLRMAESALRLCEVYDVDKELLLCGTILHDIGKLKEMDTDPMGITTYTSDGNLFGHLYLGMKMIEEAAEDLSSERVRLLLHMIASHHGRLEYGAIKTPAVKEALILHYLDQIDAGVYQHEQIVKDLEPGQSSDMIRTLGGVIYRPVE